MHPVLCKLNTGRSMLGGVSLAMCTLFACSTHSSNPTAPGGRMRPDSLPPTAVTISGEATYEVTLATSGTRPTVVPVSMTGAILPSVNTAADLGPDSVLSLPVALHNPGALRAYAPASISIGSDAFVIEGGGPTRGTFQLVGPAQLTRTRGSTDLTFATVLDATAVNPAGKRYIAPGGTSPVQLLSVKVPAGVRQFRVTIRATALRIYTIGSSAPRHEPDSIRASDGATVYPPGAFGKLRVTRDRVWLVFRHDASLDQRQAALDAVDGTVLGGRTLGAPDAYYVQIPATSGDSPVGLSIAITKLLQMPGVRFVEPHYLNFRLSPNYLRPHDYSAASWVTRLRVPPPFPPIES